MCVPPTHLLPESGQAASERPWCAKTTTQRVEVSTICSLCEKVRLLQAFGTKTVQTCMAFFLLSFSWTDHHGLLSGQMSSDCFANKTDKIRYSSLLHELGGAVSSTVNDG